MTYTILELVQGMEKGGRTKRIVETTLGLALQGWRVKILSMTPPADFVKAKYEGQVEWLELNRRPKLDLVYVFRLANLVRKEKISLIHAQCEASYFYGGLAGKLTGVPVVGTYHRSDLSYYQPDWKLRFFPRLLTHAVAISNDRMNLMTSVLNIDPAKITLIHGGIDFDTFRLLSEDDVRKLRLKLGVADRRVMLSVGHLGPIKGHDVTLRAMPHIKERFPDVLLVIAGDGSKEDYDRLHNIVAELGLENHVSLLGQVQNVIEWLNVCDLFVQPSLEEGFGLVFVEAGACQKAVVATAVGGIKDIVVNGETGFLVKPGEVGPLEKAVISLLDDPEMAQRFGAAGLDRVRKNFSLRNMSTKYHALFSAILEGKA